MNPSLPNTDQKDEREIPLWATTIILLAGFAIIAFFSGVLIKTVVGSLTPFVMVLISSLLLLRLVWDPEKKLRRKRVKAGLDASWNLWTALTTSLTFYGLSQLTDVTIGSIFVNNAEILAGFFAWAVATAFGRSVVSFVEVIRPSD